MVEKKPSTEIRRQIHVLIHLILCLNTTDLNTQPKHIYWLVIPSSRAWYLSIAIMMKNAHNQMSSNQRIRIEKPLRPCMTNNGEKEIFLKLYFQHACVFSGLTGFVLISCEKHARCSHYESSRGRWGAVQNKKENIS